MYSSISTNNSYNTFNNNNFLNINKNNSGFKNKIILPRKGRNRKNINIIINNNIEPYKKEILHSKTNEDLARYFISNSFNQNFKSSNQK